MSKEYAKELGLVELKQEDIIKVRYHECNRKPFKADGEGYVKISDLLDPEEETYYTNYDEADDMTEFILKDDYIEVYFDYYVGNFDGYALIHSENIYYQVWEENRLADGWGRAYGGGMSSAGQPTHYTIEEGYDEGSEVVYLL